jgi:hypothetical protein
LNIDTEKTTQNKIIRRLIKNKNPQKTLQLLEQETLIVQYNIIKAHKEFNSTEFFDFWQSGVDKQMLHNILRGIYNISPTTQSSIECEEAQKGDFPGVKRSLSMFEMISKEITNEITKPTDLI